MWFKISIFFNHVFLPKFDFNRLLFPSFVSFSILSPRFFFGFLRFHIVESKNRCHYSAHNQIVLGAVRLTTFFSFSLPSAVIRVRRTRRLQVKFIVCRRNQTKRQTDSTSQRSNFVQLTKVDRSREWWCNLEKGWLRFIGAVERCNRKFSFYITWTDDNTPTAELL